MRFRPCIDLHGGCVKQIVGSTLNSEEGKEESKPSGSGGVATKTTTTTSSSSLATNFSTDRPSSDYATMYQKDELTGGHVIMLGPGNEEAGRRALEAWRGGLQVGGGITNVNAQQWLDRGASHIIVTSFVFRNGAIDYERLQQLVDIVGKERLVLDLSCRRRPEDVDASTTTLEDCPYYVVTDKWQKFTNFKVDATNLQQLAQYCNEFLVHGVDVEGKQCGILEDLVTLLGQASPIPVTYAGGVRSLQDLELVKQLGQGKVDCTVGSALDIFGGSLSYQEVVDWHKNQQQQLDA